MISINAFLQIELFGMGLFESFDDWIHPIVQVDTYELIYCIAGDLKIFEGKEKYIVKPGQLFMLAPGVTHGGYDKTAEHTSFYWLHFKCSDITKLKLQKISDSCEKTAKFFREIMHYHLTNKTLAEIILVKFLLENSCNQTSKNKILFEIDEFIRINSHRAITVLEISRIFNHSPDYLSKAFKKEFHQNLKERIIEHRLSAIDVLLTNTNDSIKQIAAKMGFPDENVFVKFYKYNKGITPTRYRNSFYKIHMNNH